MIGSSEGLVIFFSVAIWLFSLSRYSLLVLILDRELLDIILLVILILCSPYTLKPEWLLPAAYTPVLSISLSYISVMVCMTFADSS